MNGEGTKAISEDHFIFDGNDPAHSAVTIEGPKVYKRNGYYYIFAPAGGVKHGYQVALRSRDIHGPYELRTVMAQGNTVINGPHQGGLVDTHEGDEWFIHFQDRGLYGRICHLQPVSWKEDWPVIGINPDENGCGEPVYEHEAPASTGAVIPKGYEHLNWQWLGDHRDSFSEAIPGSEGLRLFCLNPSQDKEPIIWRSANVLTRKLVYPVFRTEIQVDATGLESGERAGICMMGGQYVAAYIVREADEYYICTAISEGGDRGKREVPVNRWNIKELTGAQELEAGEAIKSLKFIMTFTYKDRDFDSKELYYRNVDEPMFGENPKLYIEAGIGDKLTDLGVEFAPSDHTWVGAKIGIFALSGNAMGAHGHADFRSIITTGL